MIFVLINENSMKINFILITLFCQFQLFAQQKPIGITFKASANSFPLAANGKAATIISDVQDEEVVSIAVDALKSDIRQVTGAEITNEKYAVIVGTLGKSKIIDELVRLKKIQISNIQHQWETFSISLVSSPMKGIDQALVIFGSDPRGTAFGVFELSKMIGVSPFVWWADVTPEHRDELYVTGNKSITGPPSVKYRGIFINDEDWGLHPWAAKHMDTTIKDIGPRTYQKVFELMLRLKANYLWPAMHPCTKAFWYYPENPVLARKYDIILGASHCEPLLRNNIFEWDHNFKNEYGITAGEWRYDKNKEQIDKYWNDRVLQSRNNPAVYTVGMRGIHDGSMPGPGSKEEKKTLLEQVIADQRRMLSDGLGKSAGEIPQIFCPYKEVLDLYRLNMRLPDDITLAWADDNFGYMRQLSNPQEQKRSGGSGVYYHLSYWGAPQDYLWLSTISPTLISYELTKAYELNARRLWVFNVGDIKPAEMELQFAMDFAWDIHKWTPEQASHYPEYWAENTFGKEFAKPIGDIKKEYYHLAAAGKPEHLDKIQYTSEEIEKRLADYQSLVAKSQAISKLIPARLTDAYFELIGYPVEAACSMNEKVLGKSNEAFKNIQILTEKYNKEIANGKWDGMMDDAPRRLKIFQTPETITTPEMIQQSVIITPAVNYIHKSKELKSIEGLGIESSGLTVWPMKIYTDTPYVEYKMLFHKGDNKITVRCLPDFPLYPGMKLRYAISIDHATPVFIDIATVAESKPWSVNILRGYAAGESAYTSDVSGEKTVRIYFPDPGLVVSDIVQW
ncbi:Glycosyl hydrolase family 115 [Chitinophaga sp. YR573]|nr:Glycosyl hydrolase family 115 [Chitinophaga sp. YR573]